jgi:hypothetical protein
MRRSVFAGIAVAQHLHSTALLGSVRAAFVTGMDAGLLVSAAAALAGAVVALTALPARRTPAVEAAGNPLENRPVVTG